MMQAPEKRNPGRIYQQSHTYARRGFPESTVLTYVAHRLDPYAAGMTSSSRYSRVSRRAFLGGAASLTALTGLAACGQDDALTSSSQGSAADASGQAGGTATAASGTGLPASAALTVDFTVTASTTGGKHGVRNPYIAVWVETPDEEYVQTISMWHLTGKEDKWLSDLKAWYEASGGSTTNSGATRAAGSYTVKWDLKDAKGAAVPAGEYVLYLEGVREEGAYELLKSTITLGSSAAKGTFTPENDITAASWSYTV